MADQQTPAPDWPRHFLLSFGGGMGADETWSCGIRLGAPGLENADDDAMWGWALSQTDDVHNAVASFFGAMAQYTNRAATFTWTKFNPINKAGEYIGPRTLFKTQSPLARGGAPGVTPFSVALAITFKTDTERALASAGRIYWPATVPLMEEDGTLPLAMCANVAEYAGGFITSLNNWPGLDLPWSPVAAIVSKGAPLKDGTPRPGLWRPITSVSVGNVLDTQRRRRAQQKEVRRTYKIPT